MKPQGYGDELRAALRSGGSVWGVMGLYRESGATPFDEDDVAIVSAFGAVAARALRAHVRQLSPWLEQTGEPGLLVVGQGNRVVSANGEALRWLREIAPDPAKAANLDSFEAFGLPERAFEVPTPIYALVERARAVVAGLETAPARLRMRDRSGRWLVLHASALAGPGTPDPSAVAVVIEAAKSSEIAPIIIEAYSLTAREREVVGAIARGGSTAEIAAELYLSPHTVRDHVKTVFEKVGVSSRGELVARLFAEHSLDRFKSTMVHLD
jgi:DNA-binding CsgD family transcriptional regulator